MTRDQLIPVWDAWVRLFHWSLALAVGFLLYSGLTGNLFFDWHRQAGEFVLMLIAFRLLWGVVGSSNVRLRRLFRSPAEGAHHLKLLFKREVDVEREHNAAGSWAVLAMLLIVGTQAVTGLFIADEDEFVEGALYNDVSSNISNLMYRIHHINADFIKVIVALHIAMVFFYLIYARRNLITPMITGRLKWISDAVPPAISLQKWWVGAVCIVLCAGVVGYIGQWY